MKKPAQWKICQNCNAQIPQFWKTLTYNGVRKKVCQKCAIKVERLKEKAKKDKLIAIRKAKRERVTDKKLDTVFSRLIRSMYPLTCMSCKKELTFPTSQNGHFKGRRYKRTRWDPRNCGILCLPCNYYDSSHAWELGKQLDTYWGQGNAENMRILGEQEIHLSEEQRKQLYDLFSGYHTSNIEALREIILTEYLKIVK